MRGMLSWGLLVHWRWRRVLRLAMWRALGVPIQVRGVLGWWGSLGSRCLGSRCLSSHGVMGRPWGYGGVMGSCEGHVKAMGRAWEGHGVM